MPDIILRNGDILVVKIADSSLEFSFEYLDSDLRVKANLADRNNRAGIIYETGEWDKVLPCCC